MISFMTAFCRAGDPSSSRSSRGQVGGVCVIASAAVWCRIDELACAVMRRIIEPPIEVLHESERTRVFRGGNGIVYKEPLGVTAAQRLRRELDILTRLSG